MARVSSVERFLSNDKTYLLNEKANVRLVSVFGSNIDFGRKIHLRRNSRIIMIVLDGDNLVFSISNFDGKNLDEFFFKIVPKNNYDNVFWEDIPEDCINIISANITSLLFKRDGCAERKREVN